MPVFFPRFLSISSMMLAASLVHGGLVVREVAGPPPEANVVVQQPERDETGPTSMRYYAPRSGAPTKTDDWVYNKAADNGGVHAHYYYRDRDLGQTFTTGAEGFKLKAITVRLQPVDVRGANPAHAKVSLQLLKVTGAPVINDNGTRSWTDPASQHVTSANGVSVWSGGGSYQGPCSNAQWSTYATDWPVDASDSIAPFRWAVMHYSDDFIEGEVYESLAVARGGVVPADLDTNDYMRWELTGEDQWTLQPHTSYAFLFMFDEPAAPGVNRNIPLSNKNTLPVAEASDPFPSGHMIRREGASTDREAVFIKDVNDPADVTASLISSEFPLDHNGEPDLAARLAIPPGTLGYPDVDTYRELTFYMEKVTD